MDLRRLLLLGAVAGVAVALGQGVAAAASDVTFDLRYGVLAGLTGDPAADGQAWNEAARLGIDQIAAALKA